MRTKKVISAVLVTAMSIATARMLDKYSKYKRLNQAAAIGGSFLALEYMRSENKVPVNGDIDINRKSSKTKTNTNE